MDLLSLINMKHFNVELKAKCDNQEKLRNILKEKNADFKGIDHQIDTYFKVNSGRLKLREGNIENALIFYERENKSGPKKSKILLYKPSPNPNLKEILENALGILAIVDKKREIYFIDNVKFHLDDVKGLGFFMEIEAIDEDGSIGEKKLLEQCQLYLDLFNISEKDFISCSYSDLVLEKK